jgi:hypothetical protein
MKGFRANSWAVRRHDAGTVNNNLNCLTRSVTLLILTTVIAALPLGTIAEEADKPVDTGIGQTPAVTDGSKDNQELESAQSERDRIRAEKKAERERKRAERRAEQDRIRQERAEERARVRAEQEAERNRIWEQRAAEQKKLQAARKAEQQARAEAQEKACARIDTQVEKLDTVPPEVLGRRFGGGGVDLRSPALRIPYESWLLSDEMFVPAFGEKYDEVTPEEGTELQTVMRNCQQPVNERGQAIFDNMLFYRAFDPRFKPGYLAGVEQIREARAELAGVVQQLEALSGEESAGQWSQLADSARQLEPFAGTAQRSEVQDALRKAWSEAVQPGHLRKAKQVADQAEGVQGLKSLQQLKQEFAREATLAGVPPDWPEVARARETNILNGLIDAEHRRIDSLGTGLPALEKGVAWYRDYHQSFDDTTLGSLTALREPMDYFTRKRTEALSTARAELEVRIRKTRNIGELNQLTRRYIPLSSDAGSADGQALAATVADQGEELHKREVLGLADGADGDANGTISEAQSVGPSASVMYDLVNQQLKQIAGEVSNMASKCHDSRMKSDPMLALMCAGGALMEHGGGAEPMTITSFEKLGCAVASGKPGFICDYLLQVSGGMMRGMGPGLAEIMGREGAGQARYLQSRNGWVAFFGEQ